MKRTVKAYITSIKPFLPVYNMPENVDRFILARQDPAGRLCFYWSYDDKNKAQQALKEVYNGVLIEVIND